MDDFTMDVHKYSQTGLLGSQQAHHEPTTQITHETPGTSISSVNVSHTEIDNIAHESDLGSLYPEPGFAYIDGDIGGSGYNETKVDIVVVSCPGAADPLQAWIGSDPFPDDYFTRHDDSTVAAGPHSAVRELAQDVILSPGLNQNLPKAAQVWVRQGIRKANNRARVLVYRHRSMVEGMTLEDLADDLMRCLTVLREEERVQENRPLFFVAHSVGGLVTKMLLVRASKSQAFKGLVHNCHGTAFFGTPHRGSSYLSMKNLSVSIKNLLHLERPLPRSIADDLRLGNSKLLRLNEDFKDISSELRVWTFYETIDSQLSGVGADAASTGEVRFGAPLASIKSSLLGIWPEEVFSVDSDHANCASFGTKNPRTLAMFLADLSAAVDKAEALSGSYTHHPLHLKEHVRVELIGFYEDPDDEMESAIRLYFTKHSLADFLAKGPEKCLEERLKREKKRSLSRGHRPLSGHVVDASLGIWSGVKEVFKHGRSESHSSDKPEIVVHEPSVRPAPPTSSSMPATVMRRLQSLTVPSLVSHDSQRPSRSGSVSTTASEPILDSQKEKEMLAELDAQSLTGREAVEPLVRPDPRTRTFSLQDLAAGFSRPDPDRRRFMWIHLPFLDPLWVKEIFDKLAETHQQNYSRLFNHENWESRQVQGRHSQSQPSFIKPACNYLPAGPASSPRPSSSSMRSSPPDVNPASYLYLYMPYLHFDTYSNMIKRRNLIRRRLLHGRASPVPKEVGELESLELRVVWGHLGCDPPLNCRRTLDQYGYPSLQDTYARDDDQMLYKLTKKEPHSHPVGASLRRAETHHSFFSWDSHGRRSRTLGTTSSSGLRSVSKTGEDKSQVSRISQVDFGQEDLDVGEQRLREGNVLMVDQLWLWAIDTTSLVTFFPKRESSPKEGPLFQQADLRNSVYNELNGDLTGRTENALELAAFIVLHSVTVLLERSSHPDLEIFRIFEEAIGMLAEKMTMNLKGFRTQTYQELVAGVSGSDAETDDPDSSTSKSIKKRYKRELEKAQRENRENTSALLELRDMEDELNTLLRLFIDQEVVIEAMTGHYERPDLAPLTSNGRSYLKDALGRIKEYKATTVEMLKRVDTTKKDYEKLLEMAQRQAQVDDVRWSRIQTELASSQNLSVMIFTTFTVIFLPLSFFTGLFGMNTVEWQKDVPSLSFIGSISLPVSVALIVGTLVAAFSERVQGWFMYFYRHWKRGMKWWRDKVESMTPAAAKARRERKLAARERQERLEEKRKRERRAYDFWGAVRKERDAAYQIPVVNRMGPATLGGH